MEIQTIDSEFDPEEISDVSLCWMCGAILDDEGHSIEEDDCEGCRS
jgi:hypothetical protein